MLAGTILNAVLGGWVVFVCGEIDELISVSG